VKIVAYSYCHPLLDTPTTWGEEVSQVYQDLGDRFALEQLLQDTLTNPPEILLLRCLDELGDTLEEISDRVQHLETRGVKIITTEADYTPDKLPQLFPAILKKQQSRKLQASHARNRLQALPPPGKAPYGYKRGKERYILDRSTAPVIKDFFEHFLLFGSLRGAVRHLEKRYGKKISVSTAKKWLTSPIYRGDLLYKNQDIIPNTHTAILSREEAAQIDRLLRRNSQLPPRTAGAPRSLAGLVVCQQCQSSLITARVTRRNSPQEYLYLRPKNCSQQPPCQALNYDTVLEKIIQQICQELPASVAQLQLPNLEVIRNNIIIQIQQKKQLITDVKTLENQDILDRETAQLRTYKIQGEIAQLQKQLDQLPPGELSIISQAVSLPQFWLDLSESERRFYFREFIKKVEVIESQPLTLKLFFVF
jgi:DNA invertase Pin-like site-specific DNA recombinase